MGISSEPASSLSTCSNVMISLKKHKSLATAELLPLDTKENLVQLDDGGSGIHIYNYVSIRT